MAGNDVATRLSGSPRQIGDESVGDETWSAFRKTLGPRILVVWRDIGLCYALMAAGLALVAWIERHMGWGVGLIVAPVCSCVVGFWLHALSTFGHEAAHYNLALTHSANDRLAEWFVWPMFAQTVKSYRKSHWQHHLHLGDLQDTEISYHNCLSPWFLLQTLTGLYLLQTLLRYARTNRKLADRATSGSTTGRKRSDGSTFALIRTLVIHGVIVAILAWWSLWVTTGVWVFGVLVMFPCFATVRQVLEHRRIDAKCQEDFRRTEHGPINRMFATNFFARYFGAAGFNRHLLHHWDPAISYTCFDEMEEFLMQTSLAEQLAAARTSYYATLVRMIRIAREGDAS
jgi:fatty acid desaturase